MSDILTTLDLWADAGVLNHLDAAFARFLHQEAADAHPHVYLLAALVSQALSRGHPALDLHDLVSRPDRHLDTRRADPALNLPSLTAILGQISLAQMQAALLASTCASHADTDATSPLVLDGNRLYLRRYWQCEQAIAAAIATRITTAPDPLPDNLLALLDTLFAKLRSAEEASRAEIHWQTLAAATAVRQRFTIISGGPGTGKTTAVVRLLGLLQSLALNTAEPRPLVIRLAAPTGKAAARLTESIGRAIGELDQDVQAHIPTDVSTLHRLLGARPDTRAFRHNRDFPLPLDVLVVDEASMIDLDMMAALLDALPAHARLILLGDKDQLASVEAGAVLGSLCADAIEADAPANMSACTPAHASWLADVTGYAVDTQGTPGPLADQVVVLRKSHRFNASSGIGQLARAVNSGKSAAIPSVWREGFADIGQLATTPYALKTLILDGNAKQFPPDTACSGYRAYLDLIQQGPQGDDDAWAKAIHHAFSRFRLLCAVREGDWGVQGLNARVEKVLESANLIHPDKKQWYIGRPVMVTRNDYGLGVMNGDIGITLARTESGECRLRVAFLNPDGSVSWRLPSRLNEVDTVYAMTVHKSQGSEFAHTALVLPEHDNPILTRELVYTGITRASQCFTLIEASEGMMIKAAARRTERTGGLREAVGRMMAVQTD
ncbi:exodeoxyribonuclease V subunit alpha [Burkholderiaceae bacterium DAT-1]|nr:exodeoxyribonuclease V subunit alpha [Burkholderiaceae bacterium DAT-1]